MELKNKQYDILDTQYKIKQFFKLIYRDIDREKEQIRLFINNGTRSKDSTYSKVHYFNDIDELVTFSTNKYVKYNNTYFQLNTTIGEGGADSVKYSYALGFDFDKKDIPDLDIKYIQNKFKDNKLSYHILIDSGNGYHAYILLERTDQLDLVQEVYITLADKLGADKKACKPTQLLRVPLTFNIKDYLKRVNVVFMNTKKDLEKYKPYDINFLYRKNCLNKTIREKESIGQAKYTLDRVNLPKCLEIALEEGTIEGDRYITLCNLVVALRRANRPYSEIVKVIKEWAIKSNYNDNLDYRIKNAYDNKTSLELNCNKCLMCNECKFKIKSDFEYDKDDKLITLSETNISKLKANMRKGARVMKPNDLLVYGVMKNHNDGLTREELLQELTYTKKKKVKNIALSDRTLKDTLKSLVDNGFVEVIKGNARAKIPNIYKLKEDRSKSELKYIISFSATYECIKGNISTEELRLYNYMRYLHHKEQREGTSTLKGNLFQVNQVTLGKDLGVTQGRISQMIENLLDEKLVSLWYRQQSKNNGFDYNIYRLNY